MHRKQHTIYRGSVPSLVSGIHQGSRNTCPVAKGGTTVYGFCIFIICGNQKSAHHPSFGGDSVLKLQFHG